jgi:hypothetical protein
MHTVFYPENFEGMLHLDVNSYLYLMKTFILIAVKFILCFDKLSQNQSCNQFNLIKNIQTMSKLPLNWGKKNNFQSENKCQ